MIKQEKNDGEALEISLHHRFLEIYERKTEKIIFFILLRFVKQKYWRELS